MDFTKMTSAKVIEEIGINVYDALKLRTLLSFKKSGEVVSKSDLGKRIFARYDNIGRAATVSIITTCIEVGILTDVGEGKVRMSTSDDYEKRNNLMLTKFNEV